MNDRRMVRVHLVGKEKGIVRPHELCHYLNPRDFDQLTDLPAIIEEANIEDGKQHCFLNIDHVHSVEVFMGTWSTERVRSYD